MKVTEITVSCGTTFNNPYERYSNYRPGVTLKATIEDGDNAVDVARALHVHAQLIVQTERERILAQLAEADRVASEKREAEWKRMRAQLAKKPTSGATADALDNEIPF